MVEQIAGKTVAEANAKATGKVLKTIIRDCLTGQNGRTKIEGWVPRWLQFPASGYTERGGVGAVDRSTAVAGLVDPQPSTKPIQPNG
jgi:ParB family chromosome partitioning protein